MKLYTVEDRDAVVSSPVTFSLKPEGHKYKIPTPLLSQYIPGGQLCESS
jgi:hypothetical protein